MIPHKVRVEIGMGIYLTVIVWAPSGTKNGELQRMATESLTAFIRKSAAASPLMEPRELKKA